MKRIRGVFLFGLLVSLLIAPVFAYNATHSEEVSLKPYKVLIVNYDFIDEEDIVAYRCRRYYSNELPLHLGQCDVLNDMTSNPGLDYDDELYTGDIGWEHTSLFHIFSLENVGPTSTLKKIEIDYISYNVNREYPRTHSLYIRNFAAREWELISESLIMPRSEAVFQFSTGLGDQSEYVLNGKIWLASTDGLSNFGAINSDYFHARLTYAFPLMTAEAEQIFP